MSKLANSSLGLARRANKIAVGEAVIKAIQTKKASLVLIASDASDNTKKKITDKCKYYEIKFLMVDSSEELSHLIGKNNCMSVAILDNSFATSIANCLER